MSSEIIDAPDASEIIDVAREAQHRKDQLQEVDPTKDYVSFGDSGHPVIVDLESLRETPDRASGTYLPATVDSLIKYVETHRQDGQTTVWVHESSGEIKVILDDHGAKAPAWKAHKAVLNLRPSTEWAYWAEQDGKLMGQEAFADFLEEGIPDILKPDAATLIEVAENFHATTSVIFRSGVNRTSGTVKVQYDESEESKGSTAAGEIAIPKGFTLALAPFIGEEKVEVEARIRYKATSGKLMLGYKLERPERVKEEALDRVAATLAMKFDRVYRGSPAA